MAVNNQMANLGKDFRERIMYPLALALCVGGITAFSSVWYNSKNAVPREQYYQDISKLQADVGALRKENDLLREAVDRWEVTLEKALDRIQTSLDRELSYRLPGGK